MFTMNNQAVDQLEEVRKRAESHLSSSGSAQDVKAEVQVMANIPLPLSEKYRHISAETMVKENSTGNNRLLVIESLSKIFKALSILEKYGCNLSSPAKPRYWRSVKHNNPVFRRTVDAIKGGREILYLYGYTNQQIDGLSFPDEVADPDVGKVAGVTLEVMILRSELEMLIKGTHPRPELFKDVVPFIVQQTDLVSDAVVIPPGEDGGTKSLALPKTPVIPAPATQSLVLPNSVSPAHASVPAQPSKTSTASPPASKCNCCGGAPSVICVLCGHLPLCEQCDQLFHRNPSRADHKRDKIQQDKRESCSICGGFYVFAHCSTCNQSLCVNCDKLYHSHPARQGHNRTSVTPIKPSSSSLSPWECSHCTTLNEVRAALCETCERPRLATAASSVQGDPTSPSTEWQCKSCTVMNQGSSVLCMTCERPRLATRPPVSSVPTDPGTEWICQYCTFANSKPDVVCEMCSLARKDQPAALSLKSLFQPHPNKDPPQLAPKPLPRVSMEQKRQNLMRDDGLNLIHQIRKGEKSGVTPEEVYAALCTCGGSNVDPCDWLASELPHVLDEICIKAASIQESNSKKDSGRQEGTERNEVTLEVHNQNGLGDTVQLSRAEAKQAWLTAEGDTERAVIQLLRDRKAKMRELRSLGFREVSQCEEALRLSGGEVKGALSLLQRPLLEPFHQHIWSDQPEPPIDVKNPDKQRLCRRLLALYDLPSWGRCELALALLQEPDITYSLEDVVQAVKESHDKDFIRRLLNNECPCCLGSFPRGKMQSLTSCQCLVCHSCFTQYFTIAVRDKHIRDMVCPMCNGPDINDPEQLDSHFSTLDVQLRECLEPEVFELYHKKLTEHALMKDPKFLWCCHCTFGFIYDGDQLKVTCPSCHNSFCAQCKKPWEPQHQDVSCEQFQRWKRENDPEYQKQGLAAFLRDNCITCPSCRFQYALSKGGCMHFTCTQCRYQFCSGCNNPFHTMACKTAQCKVTGLHAHHPRDCLFYLRDWGPARLQELLQKNNVEFNTNPPEEMQSDSCGVIEQKDEGDQHIDLPCGIKTQPGQAGICEKHYIEYLVSLVNEHTVDPAALYDIQELEVACARYQVDNQRGEDEDDDAYKARLLPKLMAVPLGEKVPRAK